MISKYVDYDIICDGCSSAYLSDCPHRWDLTRDSWEKGDHNVGDRTTQKPKLIRRRAKREGWRRTRSGEDICPNCQRRALDHKDMQDDSKVL